MPVVPELIAVTATIAGVSPKEYARSGKLIAECQINAQRKIGHDAIFAMADLCVEAEALGCGLSFPEDNYPHVTDIVIREFSDLKKLTVPDPSADGRMPELLKAVRISKETAGKDLPIIAHVVGPLTLASRIMDIEKMLYMIVDHPSRFAEILKFCQEVSLSFALALVKEGCDGIIVFDPSSSPSVLPEKIFKEFELPHIRNLFSAIEKANPNIIKWYSVAGPIQTNLSILNSVTADICTVDYIVPIETAMRYSGSTVINGNIKPSLFLDGTKEIVFEEAASLLAKTRSLERFILGSGCEIPLYSKVENISALVEAAKKEAEYFKDSGGKNSWTEVTISPHKKKIRVPVGSNLLDTIKKAGVKATSYCHKSASCGKCVVQIKSGNVTPPEKIERLQLRNHDYRDNHRLACCLNISEPIEVYVPYQTRVFKHHKSIPAKLYELSVKNRLDNFGFAPNISKERLDIKNLPEPAETFALKKLGMKRVDENAAKKLRQIEKSGHEAVASIIDLEKKEIIDFSVPDLIYGIAIDIGTTNVSAYLHDLSSGELICVGLTENTQSPWGSDVISRVASVMEDSSLLLLMQQKLVDDINSIISNFHNDHSINYRQIYAMTIVANPIMTHFFLGHSPESLAQSPFIPEVSEWQSTQADSNEILSKLNVNQRCRVDVLPGIGGFVGADAVAGLLASGIYENEEISLFIDLGTNGEIIIGNRNRLVCTSVSTGPVFEGAHISNGRTFRNGSIHIVDIDSDRKIRYETIGETAPLGICGSGIIDSTAAFLRHGIINTRGHFINGGQWPQLKNNFFRLVPKHETATFSPIGITSADIGEIQKAKCVIRTGIDLLTSDIGIESGDIKNIYISGSFGTCINIDNARRIGMIPDLKNAKAHFIKNSAGMGARIALLSGNAREQFVAITSRTEHINLANHEGFNNKFIDNMFFPAPQ